MRFGRLVDIDNQSVTLAEYLVPEADPVSDRPLIILHERLIGLSPLSNDAYERNLSDYQAQFEDAQKKRAERTAALSGRQDDGS